MVREHERHNRCREQFLHTVFKVCSLTVFHIVLLYASLFLHDSRFAYVVVDCVCLGSKPEVLSRIAQTTAAVAKLKVIWNDKNIAISSKIRLMRSLAMSIFVYACEPWTITADIERRIQALEMRCFRKLLGISYRDHNYNQ